MLVITLGAKDSKNELYVARLSFRIALEAWPQEEIVDGVRVGSAESEVRARPAWWAIVGMG
jgi:hypothetical protein